MTRKMENVSDTFRIELLVKILQFKHEYLRSRASRCLSLSFLLQSLFKLCNYGYRDTRAYILDLASRNFWSSKSAKIDFT